MSTEDCADADEFFDCVSDDDSNTPPSAGAAAPAAPELHDGHEEEEPLHIVDYTCATPFENLISTFESFMATTFRSQVNDGDAQNECLRASCMVSVPQSSGESSGGTQETDEDEVILRVTLLQVKATLATPGHLMENDPAMRFVGAILESEVRKDASRAAASLPFKNILLIHPQRAHHIVGTALRTALSAALCAASAVAVQFPEDRVACFAPHGAGLGLAATAGASTSGATGMMVAPQICQRFTVNRYAKPPPQCRFLDGLLDIFQMNIGLQSRITDQKKGGITVDASCLFELPGLDRSSWQSMIASENEMALLHSGHAARFGTTSDPIATLATRVCWFALSERDVIDNSVQSTFDPLENPGSTALITLVPRNPYEYVSSAVEHLSGAFELLFAHLGVLLDDERALECQADADRADPAMLLELQEAVFSPPMQSVEATRAAVSLLHNGEDRDAACDIRDAALLPNSFFSRFAHHAAKLSHADDVFDLWMMCAKELAARVEGDLGGASVLQWRRVVGLEHGGHPSLGAPLLLQKIQMLECCAEELLRSPSAAGSPCVATSERVVSGSEAPAPNKDGLRGAASTTPSFEELGENEDRVADSYEALDAAGEGVVQASLANHLKQPTGTTGTDLFLISGFGRVPLTPPPAPAPRTSDQLDAPLDDPVPQAEQERFSDRLAADMAAFVDANRGSVVHFSDFIRWHSPRDYVGTCDANGGGGGDAVNDIPQTVAPGDRLDVDVEARLLSQRMGQRSAQWWALWDSVVHRSGVPSGGKGHGPQRNQFHPLHEITLACKWLQDDVSQEELLVCVALAVLTNAMHRIAAHRSVGELPALQRTLRQVVAAARNEARWWFECGALVAAPRSAGDGCGPHPSEALSEHRCRLKRLLKLTSIAELHLSACISLQTHLLPQSANERCTRSTSEINALINEIYSTFQNEFGSLASEGLSPSCSSSSPEPKGSTLLGGAAGEHGFALSGACWAATFGGAWVDGAASRAGATAPRTAAAVGEVRSERALTASRRVFLLHAEAERPMNTRALPQWLMAELGGVPEGSAVRDPDSFTLALALAENM